MSAQVDGGRVVVAIILLFAIAGAITMLSDKPKDENPIPRIAAGLAMGVLGYFVFALLFCGVWYVIFGIGK